MGLVNIKNVCIFVVFKTNNTILNQLNKVTLMKPTINQQNIFGFVQNPTTQHASVKAFAGTGKTTTIVEAAKLVPQGKSAIFISFAKKIVEELEKRLPKSFQVQTLHSLGYSAIKASYGFRKVDGKKFWNTVKEVEELGWYENWKDENKQSPDFNLSEPLKNIEKLVSLSKVTLTDVNDKVTLLDLAVRYDIETYFGELDMAAHFMRVMDADTRTIDFNDMLSIPATKIPEHKFIKFDYIFVDEAQDLNMAQHKLLDKSLAEGGHIISVGDPFQAIYGFAGADANSYQKFLCRSGGVTELPLNETFRCGKKIIEFVRKEFPNIDIVANENNQDGEVLDEFSWKNLADNDMVLCRNTSPLVRLCYMLLKDNKKAFVMGKDIGYGIKILVEQSKATTLKAMCDYFVLTLTNTIKRICKRDNISEADSKKDYEYQRMLDKIDVVRMITESNPKVQTPKDIVQELNDISKDGSEGVCLSTMHRSKGLESDRVFILERELLPSKFAKKDWQREQERNLEYVAYTRAKKVLGFITDYK